MRDVSVVHMYTYTLADGQNGERALCFRVGQG